MHRNNTNGVGNQPIPASALRGNPQRSGFGAAYQALGRLPAGEMNKTEAAYARRLDILKAAGEILWWGFEPLTWRLAPRTSLTPDFLVLHADSSLECVDVKGGRALFTDDARVKLKVAASTFPLRFSAAFPASRKLASWDVEVFA